MSDDAQVDRWHAAYCRYYDHRRAGHRIRAAVWGWIADRRAARL